MTPRIGWHLCTTVFPFILPVLRELPRDLVEVLISEGEARGQLGASLREMGFAVRILDIPTLPAYDLIVLDQWHLIFTDRYAAYPHATTRFLCLQHSTDDWGVSIPRAQYSIRANKALAQCREKHLCVYRDENPNLCDQACALPPQVKEEFAYTGPYHLGEWVKKRHLPKIQLRQEMEEILGQTLPTDKPVVAFFLDSISHEGQLVEGLRALAPYATILYKGYEEDDAVQTALGNAIIRWPSITYAPNALRFGADYLLAGYNSGTFVTAIMVGLRVLPYYTRMIYYEGRNKKRISPYTRALGTDHAEGINQSCQLGFGTMYDILDTKNMVYALHDPALWKNYEERLPEIQRRAFGDYSIEGAVQKTVQLILKALNQRTFGEDATVIHIRQEYIVDSV